VPSSTSNSNERLPSGPWGRTWLCALAVAGLLLGAYEGAWRARGFEPSVVDSSGVWCLARGQVKSNDPNEVVLIGASRSRLGIDNETFAQVFGGHKPVQLSVDGFSCLPVLKQLSMDESFLGTVVCDVVPDHFFGSFNDFELQEQYVQACEKQTLSASLEQRLRLLVQTNLVSRLPGIAPSVLLRALATRWSLPKPYYLITLPDRSARADFSTCPDLPAQEEAWIDGMRSFHSQLTGQALDSRLDEINAMVDRIQSRGGHVVFVLFPISGPYRTLSEQTFPRTQFWDKLAARTTALTIHFSDFPALSGFHCPEGSHLDHRDAVVFTKSLAEILREKLRGQ